MKRFFLSTLCLYSCVSILTAQQALNMRPEVISPIINTDGVHLSLYAPKAENVYAIGDFAAEAIPMVRDSSGVWSVTLKDLEPEIYIYRFDVDGIKIADPANVYGVRDIATTFSMLFIPDEKTSLYAPADVLHGTVSKVWYDSPSLDMRRRMTVYTPAGYGEDADRKYPVLYLLHGMGGDEDAWPTLGRAAYILDNLIARGLAEPMIVVMPNGNSALPSAPGESVNGFTPPTTALPHTMDGTYEQSFKDIVNYVDTHYNTRAEKSGRAVAGLSMGGFHSLGISSLYPDTFDYVGLFSAAISPRANVDAPMFANRNEYLAKQFAANPKLYWIGIGTDDFLYNENVKYRQFLDSKNYPYTYFESDGGHQWKNWRKYLSTFVPLLFK